MALVELTARDGYRLGATLFQPAAANGRAVLVMAATGVPQTYYGKFSAFLAARCFTVLTFDYRGIGESLHGPVSLLHDKSAHGATRVYADTLRTMFQLDDVENPGGPSS